MSLISKSARVLANHRITETSLALPTGLPASNTRQLMTDHFLGALNATERNAQNQARRRVAPQLASGCFRIGDDIPRT